MNDDLGGGRGRLELRLMIDNNLVAEPYSDWGDCVRTLESAHDEGEIMPVTTENLRWEADGSADPQVSARKSFVAGKRPWASTPTVAGIPDDFHSAAGNEADTATFNRLREIVAPNVDLATNERTRRDLLHLHDAIRQPSVDGFVTGEKKILRHAGRIAREFGGFLVLGPDEACDLVADRRRQLPTVSIPNGPNDTTGAAQPAR